MKRRSGTLVSLSSVLVVLSIGLATYCVINTVHPHLPPPSPDITVVQWAESIPAFQVAAWKLETSRRYPNAVLVICHGEDVGGVWSFFPDKVSTVGPVSWITPLPTFPVTEGIAKLKRQYPGRRIVLMTCNPHHHRLTIPGVSYSLDSVFLLPDRLLSMRSLLEPTDVGNVFEFVED